MSKARRLASVLTLTAGVSPDTLAETLLLKKRGLSADEAAEELVRSHHDADEAGQAIVQVYKLKKAAAQGFAHLAERLRLTVHPVKAEERGHDSWRSTYFTLNNGDELIVESGKVPGGVDEAQQVWLNGKRVFHAEGTRLSDEELVEKAAEVLKERYLS